MATISNYSVSQGNGQGTISFRLEDYVPGPGDPPILLAPYSSTDGGTTLTLALSDLPPNLQVAL